MDHTNYDKFVIFMFHILLKWNTFPSLLKIKLCAQITLHNKILFSQLHTTSIIPSVYFRKGFLTHSRRENAAGSSRERYKRPFPFNFGLLLQGQSLEQSRNLNETNTFNHKAGEMRAIGRVQCFIK